MNEKRKRDDSDDAGERKAETLSCSSRILSSMIKNKIKRTEVHVELKREKKVEKRSKAQAQDAITKKALDLGEELNIFWSDFFIFLNNILKIA